VSGPQMFRIAQGFSRLTPQQRARWEDRAQAVVHSAGRVTHTSAQAEYMADRLRTELRPLTRDQQSLRRLIVEHDRVTAELAALRELADATRTYRAVRDDDPDGADWYWLAAVADRIEQAGGRS
jgi:hypothetical protein